MDAGTWWWLAAGAAVLAELLTGTFYLLMLALGLAAAALAAQMGYSSTAQLLTAAAVGAVSIGLWHVKRPRPLQPPATANPDVVLDIGQQVHVAHWQADGSAQVHYRGTHWQVRLKDAPGPSASARPAPGTYVIRAVDGSVLLVSPPASPSPAPSAMPPDAA